MSYLPVMMMARAGSRFPGGGGAVIVELRESSQAGRVASLTGGTCLPGKAARRDGTRSLSLLVDVGPDFEAHRAAVESVLVHAPATASQDGGTQQRSMNRNAPGACPGRGAGKLASPVPKGRGRGNASPLPDKSARKDPGRVRFTTGAMRLE